MDAFPSDKALCVVVALDCCIDLGGKKWSFSIITFIIPHNAVAKSTVAGWIKQILIMSGILKPYSTFSTTFSGLSLSDILKRGSWSNKATWERFCNNPILTFEENFQKLVNYWGFEKRMEVWAPLLYCHDVGRIIFDQEILWNKFQKLHNAANWLQCNWIL